MHGNKRDFSRMNHLLVKDNAIPVIWEKRRICTCGGVDSCKLCRGQSEYFEKPIYLKGVFSGIRSQERKEARIGSIPFGDAELILSDQRHQTQKGDIIIPFKNEWETTNEIINIRQGMLTFRPITIEGNITVTDQTIGELYRFVLNTDFILEADTLFGLNLYKRFVFFKKPLPRGAKRFSIRYKYLPEFLAAEASTPVVTPTSNTQSKIVLTKRTIPRDDAEVKEPLERKYQDPPIPMGFNNFEFS